MNSIWQPKRRIEEQYKRMLASLFKRMLVLDFTHPFELTQNLRSLSLSQAFNDFTRSAAVKMITGLVVEGAKTWRAAARESMQGQLIYDMLRNEMNGPIGYAVQSIITRNAELVSTFPLAIAREVNDYVLQESQKGRRSSDIADELKQQFPQIADSRINLIARTETSKASTALTKARADSLDLDWYVWRTSHDARVRDSHKHMEGVIINWREAPNPELLDRQNKNYGTYQAGDIWNCRCYPEPIVRLDMIRFPAKVHIGGSIITMNKGQFQKYAVMYQQAA